MMLKMKEKERNLKNEVVKFAILLIINVMAILIYVIIVLLIKEVILPTLSTIFTVIFGILMIILYGFLYIKIKKDGTNFHFESIGSFQRKK